MVFFAFFTAIGFGILLGVPKSIMTILQIISAWSSTFAFIFLFKRIYPGKTLKKFIRDQFAPRIKVSVLCTAVIVQGIIIALSFTLLSVSTETSLSNAGLGLFILVFIDSFVRGPLGEELGWRGYALNELQKNHSPLKSALIVGVLWGFWHTPLWFASGYVGLDLVTYILLFMIGIVSFSILVTLFFNLNKNLVIPIVLHQFFNFSLALFHGKLLDVLTYVMLLYFVAALLVVVLNPRGILYKRIEKDHL